MNLMKRTAALAMLTFAASATTTHAAPFAPKLSHDTLQSSQMENVRYRGWRGHGGWRHGGYGHRHHRRGFGPGAIVGGIVAGAIIAGAIRESRASSYDMERCAERYRSFDARTGTYLNYDGNRYVCPYLN